MFQRLIAVIRMGLYTRTGNEHFLSNEQFWIEKQKRDGRAEAERWDRMEQEEIAAAYREDEEHDRAHQEGRYWDPEHCDMCREMSDEEEREAMEEYRREHDDEDEAPPGVLTWSRVGVPDHMIDELVEKGYTPETYSRDIQDMWDEVDRIEREAEEIA